MRILLKVLLFPVVIVLSILVSVGRFLYEFSVAILGVCAMGLFMLALATWILLQDFQGAIPIFIFAYVVSPYGLPALAGLLVEGLDCINDAIKSI